MTNTIGNNIKINIFGNSHGKYIGLTMENLPSGFIIDKNEISILVKKRSSSTFFNTKRNEEDKLFFISGLFNNKTNGEPLTIIIKNKDIKSNNYSNCKYQYRPSHCDFTASIKYNKYNDYRGAGQFSGRMTLCIVIAGAILKQMLDKLFNYNLKIYSHINKLSNIQDTSYYDIRKEIIYNYFNINKKIINIDINFLLKNKNQKKLKNIKKEFLFIQKKFRNISNNDLQIINFSKQKSFLEKLIEAKKNLDTVGGEIETVIFNPPLGIGDPLFNSFESYLSSLLFSIGSIKGINFGIGSNFCNKTGDEVKDEIINIDKNGILTLFNNNGGINGGITNGEDIVFKTILKPVSSIKKPQYTYNSNKKNISYLKISGRHDVSIINRIIPIIESCCYITIFDLLINKKKFL